MSEAQRFGTPEPGISYRERRAAYAVIVREGRVATVQNRGRHFLPGGGSLPNEAPEQTVVREVREELARSVRLIRKIGEATQYFYADADDCHYHMPAVFFAAEFTDEP